MSSRTASPRTPCSARVSAGICWARSDSTKFTTLVWPRCSSARAAVSKRAQIASRSRCASRAAWPPRSTPRRSRRGQSVPDHSSQSTSSAVAPSASRARPPWSSRPRASAFAAPRSRIPSSIAGSSSASRSSSGEDRGPRGAVGASAGPASARSLLGGAGLRGRGGRLLGQRTLLPGTQGPGQRPHLGRVEAGHRGGEQRLGPVGAEVVGVGRVHHREVDHGPERVEQRHHRWLRDQRGVVAGHLDRDARGAEGPAQPRDGAAPGADQHRHLRPGQPVLEVGPAQQVGDVLGLGAVGVEGEHVRAAGAERAGLRVRVPEGGEGLGVDRPGGGQPGHDCPGQPQQPGPEPAGDPQRHRARRGAVGVRERPREVEDAADLGPPEGVDGLVRVTHHGQVAPVPGQGPQQPHLAGVGVLVLVDEDVREPGPQVGPDRGLLGQQHRAVDQLGVVDQALVVEDHLVLLHEQGGRRELRRVGGVAELLEVDRVEPLLPGPGQHLLHLAGEPAGRDRLVQRGRPQRGVPVAGEQLLEDDVLLRGRQQPQRRGVQVGGGVAADQSVGEGVERRAERGRHRAAEPGGDPVAELLGGLAAEGQRQHRLRARTPPLDAVDDRLDERRGLAGAGAGEHQQRAARVVDHRLLELVERRGCDRSGPRVGEPVRRHRSITSSVTDRTGQRRQGAGLPCSHHSSLRVSCGSTR